MELQTRLKDKIDELIQLNLNKGIAPHELMQNIYQDEYIEVKANKHFDQLFCHVTFYDEGIFDEKKIKYEYRYIYNKDLYLQEVYQMKNKSVNLLWSRLQEEQALLTEIVELFRLNSKAFKSFKSFLNTLPIEYQTMINDRLKSVKQTVGL
ncbi:hypothetical protein [Desulfitobacterium metallireducens]|uniref:Immunity protein 63 domain-containing protein n=1 Tax=Desulfitobacterium metallireducens DSM 15288 TaxID=871968 RepID=W0EFT4_9FIRM|nr:hypothetical protein [Desulfitobacterium metallireducens]AHF08373.1 hypothetical protein DESME_01060 [Desulfitobacterium metallireducens DSM 15288]